MEFVKKPVVQALCIALGLSGSVFAEEEKNQDIETVVVVGEQNSYLNPYTNTATKVDVDPLDTPLTVNVVNQQFLEDIRAETLADAYGYITGLSQSGVNANSFTLRGMSADLNSVQVNGLPGLASRFGSPTTANVERIEVLKGPASIMYGQIEPGGMINIITKKPQDVASISYDISANSYSTDVSAIGEDNSYTGTLDATGPLNSSKTWLYRMIVSAENENSYRDDVDAQNYYLFPTLSYRPNDVTDLTFGLELQSEKRVADNGLAVLNGDINQVASIDTHYQSADDTDEDKGLVAFVSFNTALNNQFDLTVDWRSVWHEDSRHLYESNDVDSATETVTVQERDQLNKREYHFVDVRTTGSIFTGDVEHRVLLGANVGLEKRDFLRERYAEYSVDFYDPVDVTDHDESALNDNHRTYDYMNYAAYLQDVIYLTDKWTLMGGLRYARQDVDYERVDTGATASQTSDAFVSQGGVVYKLFEGTSLYASYGESFNPNVVTDTDANGDTFDPEKGRQYEVGTKTNILNDKTNLTIAYFDIKKSNIVEENEFGDNELLGEVTSTGVEAELLMMPVDNWQMKLGYAYVDARVSSSEDEDVEGNRVAFSALHDAYFWSKYNLPFQVAGGVLGSTLGINYEGSRYTDEDVTSRIELPSYTTVDIGLHYELEHYRASLNIENLFDELYYVGGNNDYRLYAGDPRNITLSLSGKF